MLLDKENINMIKEGWSTNLINKFKDKFVTFFTKLKHQIQYNNQLQDIFLKYAKGESLTKEELETVKTITVDTLKIIGLGSLLLTPIPGGAILMLFLINSAKKVGINLIPSHFESLTTHMNQKEYLKWKRNNVSYRGMIVKGEENGGSAILGNGLYSAALSNKSMAKGYGDVYFVVGARPKNPKIFKTLNNWEIWFYNTLVYQYSKEKGKEYPDKRDFYANTTIEDEMIKLGYDGIEITGREYVNFTPIENILYFKTEDELKAYYVNIASKINEQLDTDKIFTGNEVNQHIKDITPDSNDLPDYFMKHLIKPRKFKIKLVNLLDLLKTDPSFKEYYQSGENRYEFDEIEENNLEYELVIVDNLLLDGYSRASNLLRTNILETYAFVAI